MPTYNKPQRGGALHRRHTPLAVLHTKPRSLLACTPPRGAVLLHTQEVITCPAVRAQSAKTQLLW